MKYQNIRNNTHTRLVKAEVAKQSKTVEEALKEKFPGADIIVIVNRKGRTVGTNNLNSDPFVAKKDPN